MRLWSLQAVRFFAAFGVVYFHAAYTARNVAGDWGPIGRAGSLIGLAGVDVFFVLSGVVITFAAHKTTVRSFIAARISRIWPIYLVSLSPFLLIAVLDGTFGWREALASLLLIPVTDVITAPALPVAWTLCFEVLFYAAMALTIWRPKATGLLLAAYAAALMLRSTPLLQFIGNPLVLEFLLGVALTRLHRWRPAIAGIPIGLALLVAGAMTETFPILTRTELLQGDHAWSMVATQGLPAALIVWGALQIDLKPGVFTKLGDASYSLYLTHMLVLMVIMAAIRFSGVNPSADAVVIVGCVVSVLFAWRVHELIEKPLLAVFRGGRPAFGPANRPQRII